jgi:predicted HTH transcriptional regulator
MTLDLYRDDLNRPSGTELYSAIEAFCRISEIIDNRPQEGFLLDFKQEWSEKTLRTVASFANTFGGLLFVGISEENAKPKEIIGIQSNCEIKTQIASSIASNISPTPPYDIAECSSPGEPAKRLCIVRVRKSAQLHLLTKKNEQPVYVRNADESRPAQAAELRALIEQRSGLATHAFDLPGLAHAVLRPS